MNSHLDRIHHFKGTPYDSGLAAGRTLGARLEQTIDHYITARAHASDMVKLHQGAVPWLRSLPQRFQDELQGMADGAQLPLQKLAEWSYIEECEAKRCSGAVVLFDGRAWVARNNDTYVPELWGYATIREVEGRIPTIGFSMEGDVFAPTGINKERLWLHYNFLAAWDEPGPGRPHVPPYVFLTEALELCRTIGDVEALLNSTDRDGGMLLFVVDGKDEDVALFDCLCSRHYRRQPSDGWIVGTNHCCACEDLTLTDADWEPMGTLSRFRRMETLVRALSVSRTPPTLPADLIHILADDAIERRDNRLTTAYANVACPSSGEMWYTFGGYPAASRGNWQQLAWPWDDRTTSGSCSPGTRKRPPPSCSV
jgi:hypothetical protein